MVGLGLVDEVVIDVDIEAYFGVPFETLRVA
jgi:hypothetical protein